MKIYTLVATACISGGLLMSCGGGNASSEATEETTQTEPAAETTVEVTDAMIDTEASMVNWEGTMLGVYAHSGTIQLTEGMLTMEGDKITGGKFVVDMTSMTPTDENYSEENTAEMLVGHLSSGDFFAVEQFPTATFEVTGSTGNTVTGMLTIRDKTNEETIENVTVADGKATGTLTFDRQKYDVSWTSGVEDKVLSDDIELNIELTMAQG